MSDTTLLAWIAVASIAFARPLTALTYIVGDWIAGEDH